MPRRPWSIRAWLRPLRVIALLAGAGICAASSAVAGAADANPFVTLYPALGRAPAPAWLRQGTRITYYSAAASVLGGKHRYVEDPGGGWIDKQTGKRYKQEELSSASGHGYTQVNVAWLDGAVAVLDVRSYGITGVNGPPVILALNGALGLPGAGGDFWLSPRVLAGISNVSAPGMTILRARYPLNGKQVNAIRFQGEGQAWVYDLNTGVLLHSSASGQGSAIQGPTARGESRQGSTFLSQNTLVDVHSTNLSWAFAAAPGWVMSTRVLRYQGTMAQRVPGSPAFPVPVSVTFQRLGGGVNWARYRQVTVQGGMGGIPPNTSEVERAFGPASLGGLWISPQALSRLHSGQVLDSDPVTKVTASVGQIGVTPQGNATIAITELSVGQRIDYLYDRNSGLLLYSSSFDKVLNARTEFRLVHRE